ncbi:uncharacterized protein F4812DRAFT_78632 [Daldinia caldariorum]|uniref:uncharacterized protein n=1 Tax=Daldinia caldariorum TaxID=326644 RepID=UPI00200839AF|nr:uncharacterized protein F4812DRAFT_78632 [Daldinia caldariorum]KAI1466424.1 hypothetical protein F4812DRAFT_78632 [Daldinia caldariorum]
MDNFHGFSNMGNGWQSNMSSLGYPNGFSQASFSTNSTLGVINQFKVMAANSIRQSTIILSAFNTVSAFATAAGIYYDSYTRAKRSNPDGKQKVNAFRCVQGPATYPFLLSLGITIQGIIFAVAQSYGLNSIFLRGCSLISQLMWPTIFIVPYIQLVFGLEVTIRALRSRPFLPRSKWNVPICLIVIKVLLLATGLVGYFVQPPNFCFASLFWFVAKWAEGGFVILLLIATTLAICAVIIFLKLTRHSTIEDSERISASRMVYFLILAVVTNALIVPFFISLTFSNPMEDSGSSGLTLSMISTVVANVSGLTTGGLHLFLRSNSIATIGSSSKLGEYERQKLKLQYEAEAANSMDFNGHILKPVSGPVSFSKTGSEESLIGEKSDAMERGMSPYSMDSPMYSPMKPNPLRSNAVFGTPNFSFPRAPEPVQVSAIPSANSHSRKPSASYKLFPNKNQNNTTSVALLPSTTYNSNPQPTFTINGLPPDDVDDFLQPPPSIRTSWGGGSRDSSMSSSTTVQIGIRISNIADIGAMQSEVSTGTERVYSIDCPQDDQSMNVYRPGPLAVSNASNITPPQSSYSRDSNIKDFPPMAAKSPKSDDEGSECTLNPTVYDPNSPTKSKTPSPKGVGFNVPRRTNTSPIQGTSTRLPPRNRGDSSAASNGRPNWI